MINPIDEDDLQVWMRVKKDKRPSEYPHLNEALQALMSREVESMVFHLYNIDKQIATCREELRLLQPHGSGRMDVRFWGSYLPGRHPTPFLWKGMPAGYNMPMKKGQKLSKTRSLAQRTSRRHLYAPHKIAPKGLILKLKRRGKFRETLEKVKEVVRDLQRLFDMRATILENNRRYRIGNSKAIAAQHEEISRMIDRSEVRMPLAQAEFDKRYDELAARRSAHLLLLDEEDKRLAQKGYQFGTMPTPADDKGV